MGGMGSGRYRWHTKKRTVESCWTVDSAHIFREAYTPADVQSGVKERRSLVYRKGGAMFAVRLRLDYLPEPALYIEAPLTRGTVTTAARLLSVPCHFGGERFYFECPTCRRRVRCLYLPYMAWRFACRRCHDLTYETQQDTMRTGLPVPEWHYLSQIWKLEADMARCKRRRKRYWRLWSKYMDYSRRVGIATRAWKGQETAQKGRRKG